MRYAIVIGNDRYADQKLAQLKTPSADSRALVKILKDPRIGAFDEVLSFVNKTEVQVRRAINTFLKNRKPDDLVLVYFSGHGVLDSRGRLFLALRDTQVGSLNSTAIPSSFIVDEMDSCRSKRQILILDCCHSGAFGRGIKAGDHKAVTEATFEGNGYGRFVLTASDSTQFALEGDQVIQQTELSLFTHYLLEGLQTGHADTDQDGFISLDEWYEYAYARVLSATPTQVPHKWSYHQQGDLIIARNLSGKSVQSELPARLPETDLESQKSQKAETGVPGDSTREAGEGRLWQFDSSLGEILSDVARSVRSTVTGLPLFLRIAGFTGIGVVLLWGGSLFVPGSAPPTATETATQPPPARSTSTITPLIPTKSPTPTARATITHTPTLTPTLEPGYSIVEPDEVLNIAYTLRSLGQLAVEKYQGEDLKKMNTTLTFTVNSTPDVPILWRWFWCAATGRILEQNMTKISILFDADGYLIPEERLAKVIFTNPDPTYEGWQCLTYETVLRDWKPGTYKLAHTVTFAAPVNDGRDNFEAGYRTYEYTVNISE